MAITHLWSVGSNLQTKTQDQYSNVVFSVVCKLYSSETIDGRLYKCSSLVNVLLDTGNISNFVNFEDLSEELVLRWAKDTIDQQSQNEQAHPSCADMEKGHVKNINDQINPPTQNNVAPWVETEIIPEDPNPPE